ncbi:MAG: hypothetical protein HN341_19835 [Verrucomicrobia bacterium]|jgi:hypothetical protein|nr:hypothetical protein [Verrucomicrobiota bacterium]
MSSNATQDIELSVDGYCTFGSIEAFIPHRALSSTSKPTRRLALGIVRDVKAQIDGALDVLGYTIPVVSTNGTSIRILSRLNALGSAAAIESAAYSSGNAQMSQHGQVMANEFKMVWRSFETGKIALPGADRGSNYMHREDEKHPASQFHVVSGTQQDPSFTKDMEF